MNRALKFLLVGGIVGGGTYMAGRWRQSRSAAYNMNFGQPTPYLDQDSDMRYALEQMHVFSRFCPDIFAKIVQHMEVLCSAYIKAQQRTADHTSQPKIAMRSEVALEKLLRTFQAQVKAQGRGFPEIMVLWPDRIDMLKEVIADTCYNTQNAIHESMMYVNV